MIKDILKNVDTSLVVQSLVNVLKFEWNFYVKVRLTGLYVNFFVHSTGAKEVDSFIAQTKKLAALLDISKISKNNHK